ncbi:DnaJ family domain-containing protein [Paenibacillus durus]|uniref:Molecular chaperone DnaJ n=1 Tax=Paenibacillus durus ATCC 35681 TaxID=1333534 RepID=A0A0F7F8V9_PAEDU|nr:DnaJ family domain-containing protein [Paenibacillus durus]AKG34698.1 molecular chaperone DnaJ [Paenibacillus durus ATCC 35681]
MAVMSWLAEQRIEEAMRKGEFRNLPGHGKPLELEDLSGVPEELRMSFKIMKNAGLLPEELQLRAECATLENLLAACHDSGAEKRTLSRRLTEKKLRLEELLRQRGLDGSAAFAQYGEQIRMRLDKE